MNKITLFFAIAIFCSSAVAQSSIFKQKFNSDFRNTSEVLGEELVVWNNYLFASSPIDGYDSTNANYVLASGSIHVFKKSNNKWILHQKLNAPQNDRNPNDLIGRSIDADNGYLIVGAHQEDLDENGIDTLESAGAAYVFKLSPNGYWLFHQKLVASDRETYDNFGTSVSISWTHIVIGSPSEDHDNNGLNFLSAAGSVYVFELNAGIWVESQKIVSKDRRAIDLLGTSVSVSQNRLIIGCDGTDYDSSNTFLNAAGSFYYFEKNTAGIWQEIQKVTPLNRYSGDNFGDQVLLKDSIAVIGAYRHDLNASGTSFLSDAGAIYVFDLDQANHWQERQKLVHSDRQVNDNLGTAFDFNEDFLIAGVYYQDFDASGGNNLNWAGAAYVYELDSLGQFAFENKIVASDRNAVDRFGTAVAMDGTNFLSGAIGQDFDSLGNNYVDASGAVYMYQYCGNRFYKNTRICKGDSIYLKGSYRKKSGIFSEIFTNSSSCDSVVITKLMVDTFDLTMFQGTDTIFAKLSSGSYQWYNCKNDSAIPNETNSFYVPKDGDSVRVELQLANCTYQSDCFWTDKKPASSGLINAESNKLISIFPNPNSGEIQINSKEEILTIDLFNSTGIKVTGTVLRASKSKWRLPTNISNGFYLLNIQFTDGTISQQKIIIRK